MSLLRRDNGSLGPVFDHVAIAVTDLAASERFYRTVLSALGAEPSHADAELVEWDDWDIGAIDRRAPRGPRPARRLPSAVPRGRGRLLAGGDRRGLPRRRRAGAAPGLPPRLLRRLPARPGRQQRGGGAHEPRVPRPRRPHRPPLDPRPQPRRVQALLHDDRPARRVAARHRRARPRPDDRRGLQLLADSTTSGRSRSTSTSRSRRRTTRPCARSTPPRSPRATRTTAAPASAAVYHPGYYGAFVLDPDGHNIELVNHNR